MTETNSIFLKALRKEKLDVPPIWYMRQAGRYMPEYRAVRKQFKNFLDMCKNPDVCCELALQPINAFNLDASILFSDILTIPDALGLGVEFLEGEGPVFKNPILYPKDVKNLPEFDPNELSYVYKAVTNIRQALPIDIPLIGFCGSPWTLAAYSIEGRSSKDFKYTKEFIKVNNNEAHIFLDKLTDACFLYLKHQVNAGADVIQIFDSWANLLDEKNYENYSMSYIKKLIKLLKNDSETKNIPVILFARDPVFNSNVMTESGADCLSLYWKAQNLDLNFLSEKVALQGNLNPKILLEDKNTINKEVKKILAIFKDYPGYIFNLGHGITPDINPDNVKYLTELIRSI
ncbi:MAG: uroporphyrinogen decarboxylase [Proteobacteria bacterium]|jgi:uroporphyrinogen decarboxylase|uniref:Uroporphyrinogen decarboxylase n=1 Tax=SAR86 cluster bacterium TaxID=2030880 RepID=A0A937I6S9_9GAMM|nr:uroporphyrinogen decarboxylase [SAR86 cluster bacterium]MDA0774903.1 uroporphyrinogen decarboxylase [Pseudomonadota bacterium]MDA0975765.1 uroporphyrinogen decarboxylase [Pseudomonadota bacterium]MDA1036934.1 uroporphyrinogen decarboxylase [Pseudomonadota bacterium]